jgi:uridine kinase
MHPTRAAILARVALYLRGVRVPHPLRVGVDGITSAGKTTIADELAVLITAGGRDAIRTGA